jgi:hypothetical protein
LSLLVLPHGSRGLALLSTDRGNQSSTLGFMFLTCAAGFRHDFFRVH